MQDTIIRIDYTRATATDTWQGTRPSVVAQGGECIDFMKVVRNGAGYMLAAGGQEISTPRTHTSISPDGLNKVVWRAEKRGE